MNIADAIKEHKINQTTENTENKCTKALFIEKNLQDNYSPWLSFYFLSVTNNTSCAPVGGPSASYEDYKDNDDETRHYLK